MELFFGILGISALVYMGLIVLYYGLTAFLWFWPVFALANILMMFAVRRVKLLKNRGEEAKTGHYVFFFASYGLGAAILISILILIIANSGTRERQELDYVIVLGTDLVNNKMSETLKGRLDRAIEYGRQNPSTVFVLSGGRRAYARNTAATGMYYYMIQHGIPEERCLLEFYSQSVQEQIGFSLQVIGQDHDLRMKETRMLVRMAAAPGERKDIIVGKERPLSVGVITSRPNMFRAKLLAERFEVLDPCLIAAGGDGLLLVHQYVQEAVRLFKDRLIGNL